MNYFRRQYQKLVFFFEDFWMLFAIVALVAFAVRGIICSTSWFQKIVRLLFQV